MMLFVCLTWHSVLSLSQVSSLAITRAEQDINILKGIIVMLLCPRSDSGVSGAWPALSHVSVSHSLLSWQYTLHSHLTLIIIITCLWSLITNTCNNSAKTHFTIKNKLFLSLFVFFLFFRLLNETDESQCLQSNKTITLKYKLITNYNFFSETLKHCVYYNNMPKLCCVYIYDISSQVLNFSARWTFLACTAHHTKFLIF